MDPITQGLLGAGAVNSTLLPKLEKRAWLVGMLAGMAPDLDVVIRRTAEEPLRSILYHRHFTHALAFIPIGGFVVAVLLWLVLKDCRQKFGWLLLAAIIGYATHGILDAVTSYGTMLFWPLSNYRVSLDIIPIIDPAFTFALVLGVTASQVNRSMTPARLALLFCCLYLGFGYWQRERALTEQGQLITERHQVAINRRVIPQIASLCRWRSAYIANGNVYSDVILTPLFSHNSVIPGFSLPHWQVSDLPTAAAKQPQILRDAKIFTWFNQGLTMKVQDNPLIIADGRYAFGIKQPYFLWGIQFPNDARQKTVTWTRAIPVKR